MPCFEAVSWSSCSRFKHCAMHSAIRSPKFNPIGAIGLRAWVMILFDRQLGTASFQPCSFFGVSLINEAGRWRAVIARGMKSSAGQTRHWVRGFALPFQIFRVPGWRGTE
jgi:hypothetical protein